MLKPRSVLQPYLFIAPTLLLLWVFFLIPLGLAFYQSLFEWDLLTPPTYVRLENYHKLLQSGEAFETLWITLRFAFVVVIGAISLGLGLALVLNHPGRLAALVRGCIFSSYVVSWVSVALLWMWMLDADSGLIGRPLAALGIGRDGLLSHPDTALYTLAGVTIWKITGYSMIVFLAGLQDIPKELLEAAALDGAGRWNRFLHVTWPMLRPTTAFVATTSLIISFQSFDIIRVMTQGGPSHSTSVFIYAIYEHIFHNLHVGKASAMVVMFFALLLVLTLLQLGSWRMGTQRGRA